MKIQKNTLITGNTDLDSDLNKTVEDVIRKYNPIRLRESLEDSKVFTSVYKLPGFLLITGLVHHRIMIVGSGTDEYYEICQSLDTNEDDLENVADMLDMAIIYALQPHEILEAYKIGLINKFKAGQLDKENEIKLALKQTFGFLA